MESFKQNLEELYLNYDTLQELLSDNTSVDEICELFNEEVEYSNELTQSLISLRKSYLRSVIMRIKVKMKKHSVDEVHNDLLKFNSSLSPLLNKLLSLESSNLEEESVEEEVEQELIEEDQDDEYHLKEFVSKYINETNNDEDFTKLNTIYEHYQEFYEENENYNEASKKDLKKFLNEKYGKSSKGGYTKIKLI